MTIYRSNQSGSATTLAVIIMGVAGAIASSMYMSGEAKLRQAIQERNISALRHNNLNALEMVSNLLLSGAIVVTPKTKGTSKSPNDYTFETGSKSSAWKLNKNVVNIGGCANYRSDNSTTDKLNVGCSDDSKITTTVSIDEINIASNSVIVSAKSKTANAKQNRTDRAELGVKTANCDEYLNPVNIESAKGFLATASWKNDGHGLDGKSSSVWVYPSLYDGNYVGNDYVFKFYIYWNWKREDLNGSTVGTALAGQSLAPPGTTGPSRKNGAKYTQSWGNILDYACGHPKLNRCAAWGRSFESKCYTGNNCDRREIQATMVDARIGRCDASGLILTSLGFRKRTDGGGCFPVSARVRMADGSFKYVGEILEGDEVHNPITGKSSTVTNVVGGPEKKPLLKISVEETSLTVTDGHPVRTTSGFIAARDVKAGDEIFYNKDRTAVVQQIEYLDKADETFVMNFEVGSDNNAPDDHAIEVDGVVVGDLFLQKSLKSAAE